MSYVYVNVSRQGYSHYSGAWHQTQNSYIGWSGGSTTDMTCFTLVPGSNATSLTLSFTMRNIPGTCPVRYSTTMPSGTGGGTTKSISNSGNSITITGTFYAGQSYTIYVWGNRDISPAVGSFECIGASAGGEYNPPTPPDDGSLARVHHGGSFVQYEAMVHHSGAWVQYEPYVYMSGQWRKMG